MIFHENRLLADDSREISYIVFFSKIMKDVIKFVVCYSCDWRFKGILYYFFPYVATVNIVFKIFYG